LRKNVKKTADYRKAMYLQPLCKLAFIQLTAVDKSTSYHANQAKEDTYLATTGQ